MNTVTHWAVSLNIAAIIVTILVTLAFYYVGTAVVVKVVKRAVERTKQRHDIHQKDIEKRQKTLVALFINVWRVLVIVVGSLELFTYLFPSVSLAPLFASAGIIGVALGFGSQSLVKDFLSGIFIISENQYRVGDIIEIDSAGGTVERIGARSTVLRDADGNVHYFPNGMIQHVVNKTMGYSMARFSISVHPSSDLDSVVAIINSTGNKLASEEKWKPKIIEAPSFISVGEFTSTSVSLLIAGKTQPSDQWSVTAEMRRRLLTEFEEQGVTLSAALPPAASSATKKK
jgi:small-conductance mechanosensitive channel